MEHAANIRAQIEKHDRYTVPAEFLVSEMTKVENQGKAFPKCLTLKHIGITIYNKIPQELRYDEDEEEAEEFTAATVIRKMNTENRGTTRPPRREQQKSTHKEEEYKPRTFDPDKKCQYCGMYGHDGAKGDGCDFTAAHLHAMTSVKKMSYKDKMTLKQKWKEHQEATKKRKLQARKSRNALRKQLRALRTSEPEEEYLEIKKFTINTYKEMYPLEDWSDPFADETNGISEYEDLDTDEPLDD